MAKRFTDTNKYRKAFYKKLPGAYKLFWDYLYHDCDHAGIWIVDFEVAQLYVGRDMDLDKAIAEYIFNEDEIRIIPFDNGKKWFIPSFITFQYGKLSDKNRAHSSAIDTLKKFNLLNEDLSPIQIIPKPLWQEPKGDKDKDMDKDKDKEQEQVKKKFNQRPTPETFNGLPDEKIKESIRLIKVTQNKTLQPEIIQELWEVFKTQNLDGVEFYESEAKVYRHFTNWVKDKKINISDGTVANSTIKPSNKGAGAALLVGLLKDERKDFHDG